MFVKTTIDVRQLLCSTAVAQLPCNDQQIRVREVFSCNNKLVNFMRCFRVFERVDRMNWLDNASRVRSEYFLRSSESRKNTNCRLNRERRAKMTKIKNYSKSIHYISSKKNLNNNSKLESEE